ncbi:MAG: hypothetical protein OXC41_07635 [Gammaproteobacteria bacterium]|nr:hypothetical protein [Gammaproteobacteria bacterium]
MKLKQFLRAATKYERGELAVVCNNSIPYLYLLAGQHRYASALMATRIEHKTRQVALGTNGRLEAVPRETLVRHPEIFDRPGEAPAAPDPEK